MVDNKNIFPNPQDDPSRAGRNFVPFDPSQLGLDPDDAYTRELIQRSNGDAGIALGLIVIDDIQEQRHNPDFLAKRRFQTPEDRLRMADDAILGFQAAIDRRRRMILPPDQT